MKNAQPEPHDFTFSIAGTNYSIGFQDDEFEAFAMSASSNNGSIWSWVVKEEIYDKNLESFGGAVSFLTNFLIRCNEKLKLGDDIPPIPDNEFQKLLHLVEHSLVFDKDNGVILL